MKSKFPGFPAQGIAFLRDLQKHNDRDWFMPRKELFEEKVRQPMFALVGAIHQEMLRFAPEYVGEPNKCVYRIYRDRRFSKNKTPYKTYTSALFWRNGMGKDDGASFYFGVSPEGIDVGGGLYHPAPDTLLAIRRQIADDAGEFRSHFETRKVKKLFGVMRGESLSRVPKGFDADHPAVDLLKRKQYLLWSNLEPKLATTPKLLGELVSRFEAAAPFIDYLNRPLIVQHKKRKQDEKFLR